LVACTIVARNYLAHARVLAKSLHEHHPDGSFTVVLLDGKPDDLKPDRELFDILTTDELGIESRELHRMAAIYSVTEFATAIKPWVLSTLLERAETITYFDPDIQVLARLDDIPSLAVEHGIVLTPHTLEPLPRDGLQPNETLILQAGMFNLGFISVGTSARPFLEWWSERLARDCVVAPERARFVDQRWVDFVPSLFEHVVLRDPGLNVAWWNLSRRTVRWAPGWEVDGTPIRFFHFSGFSPDSPRLLTKHAGASARVLLDDQPDLRRLCGAYRSSLLDAGYARWSREPYGLDTSATGVDLDAAIRARYRAELQSAEAGMGSVPPDPFDSAEGDAFAGWVESDPHYVRRPTGVNVVGYFRVESGVGEAARLLVKGIAEADVPYSTRTYSNAISRQQHEFRDVGSADYEFNVVCVNADQLPTFAKDVGEAFLLDHYSIGVWFWEASIFPREMQAAFNLVDEVWVASAYIADAISAETDKPVLTFPLPVVVPDVSGITRQDVGLDDAFTFLFMFDFLSVFERKNPIAVMRAFKEAFRPGEGPVLVIKSINGDGAPELMKRLRDEAEGREDIRLMDGYLTAREKSAMIALCDSYVSLHRSEGFGLTMAEAMAYGRPVVATGYGGNTTFMSDSNSYLVPYQLVPIPSGAAPYPTEGDWADPDVVHAAGAMRRVREHPDEAQEVARRGQAEIGRNHSPRLAGEFVASRLKHLDATARRPGRDKLGVLTRAELAVAEGPGGAGFGGRSGDRLTKRLRGALRRALWPYLRHQNDIDRAIVGILADLAADQRSYERRLRRIEQRLGRQVETDEKETRP
jgi:glycosyltransferase involved in cell wall biosynthesis